MKRKFLAFAILAIVFLLSSATTKVLIIGVGEFYDKRVTKLPGAITDVRAFRDAVVELGIAEQDNIQLLENPSLGVFQGKYTITVDSEKMEKWERQVEFKSDYDMQEVKVEAQIATRPVRVITEPIGVKLWIDGKEVGTSPWQGKIDVGRMVEIKAWSQGYRIEERKINVPIKGEMIEVKITLKKTYHHKHQNYQNQQMEHKTYHLKLF